MNTKENKDSKLTDSKRKTAVAGMLLGDVLLLDDFGLKAVSTAARQQYERCVKQGTRKWSPGIDLDCLNAIALCGVLEMVNPASLEKIIDRIDSLSKKLSTQEKETINK
jgi:hypothetical protein